MAAGMNSIKSRIKSVGSTMQITKAMELVATSKLRRAKERAEASRPYLETLEAAIANLLSSDDALATPYLENRPGKHLIIVVAGDRGLAGGYNTNVFRAAASFTSQGDAVVLPVGKKAVERYTKSGVPLFDRSLPEVGDLGVGDAMTAAEAICRAFREGDIARVTLVSTDFVSVMTQVPKIRAMLPLAPREGRRSSPAYDGDMEEILDAIVPDYLGGILWSAISESVASETAARRTAMNAANKNAEEMIDDLMLRYNRARQALITQEITEITSGAEAL